MRFKDLIKEDGRIVKGVNTTADVGPNEITIQAKKFGNSVDKDGRPPTLSKKVKGKSTNVLFNLGLTEGIQLKFERGQDFDTLHIKPKGKNRVELRGKPGYESGNYDAQDKLHQVLDKLGKAANFSELMNGETVSINPKHPDGDRAKKTAQDILSTESVDNDPDSVLYFEHMKETLGEIAQATEIYVDMDGVLADFFGEWAKLMKVDHFTKIDQEHDINDALQAIRDTDQFWLELPLLPQAKQLLTLIKQVKGEYNICSSPLADDPKSEPHKREWIKKNLSFFPPKNIYITHNKPQYATQEDGTPNILIDDFGKNITEWEAAGGIGFKYKDHKFERTANAIKQHMEEPVEESIIVEHPAVIAALYAAGTTVRELVKRYGLKAVRQALDKLKNQRANTQRPANDHGGPIDDLIGAAKRPRTPDEIARFQQSNLPRALDNAKAWIRTTSRDFRAGKLSREEFDKIMQYVRHNFRNKTGRDLPIEDFLKLTEKWSAKYKRSINCNNPKGFSQKAHCAGRKKNEEVEENFADGKKKGKSRPGRVKRAGASCKGSVTSLRKRAKNSSGERAKMYHWCANMKSGRKK